MTRGEYKVAGFFHEIILMNYGGVKLHKDFLQRAYACCRERDVPIIVDEIQSCIWSPELFLFREYGLSPDFVSVGKGFPGGEYAASRLLTTASMDSLNQFRRACDQWTGGTCRINLSRDNGICSSQSRPYPGSRRVL